MKRNPRVLTGPHGLIRSIGAHRTLVATARLQFLALLRDGIVAITALAYSYVKADGLSYQSLLDQEYAKTLAKGHNFGIAEALVRQFDKHVNGKK